MGATKAFHIFTIGVVALFAAGCQSIHYETGRVELSPGERRSWVVDGLDITWTVTNNGPGEVRMIASESVHATLRAEDQHAMGLNRAHSASPITVTLHNSGPDQMTVVLWEFRGPQGWELRERGAAERD